MRIVAIVLAAACGTAPSPEPTVPEAPAEVPAEAAAEATPASVDGWTTYGEALPDTTPLPVKAVFDTPDAYADKHVVVEGPVADVCQKAGCWMVVADGDRTMRIRMADHAFAVPKDCSGQTARIAGTVIAKEVDPADAEHFASEAARPEVMPEQPGVERTFELIATGVALPTATQAE